MGVIKDWAYAVLESVQEAGLKYGVKRLASELGQSTSTIYNEMNPGGLTDLNPQGRPKHKLGVLDWVEIQRLSGDPSSLFEVAKLLGYLCYSMPDSGQTTSDFLKLQANAAKEHGEAAAKLLQALSENSPGGRKLTPEEMKECATEHYEAAQAHMFLCEALMKASR